MKTFVVTWAQNATPVHRPLLASLKRFCKEHDAELAVVPGRYRNPTSRWSSKDENDDWWDASLGPLEEARRGLAPKLCLYGDISIQPTAIRPLSGFEPFLGLASGVFGHPKRAMEVVPDGGRSPRVMWTTGAVTVPNYTASRAGKRAERHHALGALVVEVDGDGGLFFCRHLCADDKGEFYDLGRKYSPRGSTRATPALSLTLGDYHAGQEDEAVLEATEGLVAETRPENLVLHDVLDFHARSHHRRDKASRYDSRFDSVESEVKAAVWALSRVQGWAPEAQLWVVRSNHDEAFERWLEEADSASDPVNAEFFHLMWSRRLQWRRERGSWPNCFELCTLAEGLGGVTFMSRDTSLLLGGVEHAFHGDRGVSGTRGSTQAFTKVGVKVTKGHDHTPCIRDGVYSAGVTGALDHGYNTPPSTWMNAHVLQYADGRRSVICIFKGRYRGQ